MKQNILITISNFGKITIELDDSLAFHNCHKLIELIQLKLFDHRVIQRIAYDFVLQFTYENFQDPALECILPMEPSLTPFVRGTVGLGGDGSDISSPADFFITLSDHHQRILNGRFSAVGKVIDGMDVVEAITKVKCKKVIMDDAPGVEINQPVEDIIIESIRLLDSERE